MSSESAGKKLIRSYGEGLFKAKLRRLLEKTRHDIISGADKAFLSGKEREQTLEKRLKKLMLLFKQQERVTLAEFRKETGLNRNLAVTIPEQMDEKGVARRKGEGRILRIDPADKDIIS
ncbi:MAG: SelB C-terminal domain-containing protein [Candidatus Aureabacteria bacterium]|nr:SelB C-terminal domain-containing protein [Candidatus Auribacterota bacterium]